MPKNKISDLRNHLFAQLERLGDEEITDGNLQREIDRADAISQVAGKIIESAKVEVDFIRGTRNAEWMSEIFDTTKAIGSGDGKK